MTESPEAATAAKARKKPTSLNGMLVADLKAMAGALGIADAEQMRKPQLVEAIKNLQDGAAADKAAAPARQPAQETAQKPARERARKTAQKPDEKADEPSADRPAEQSAETEGGERPSRRSRRSRGQGDGQQPDGAEKQGNQQGSQQDEKSGGNQQGNQQKGQKGQQRGDKQPQQKQGGQQGNQQKSGDKQQGGQQNNQQGGQQNNQQGQNNPGNQNLQQDEDDDEEGGGRRNRRRRARERERGRTRGEVDTTILEDDVLVPAAGILDVLENYAFVRTTGYLPGPDDVYVSLSMVRKHGLRRGDAVTGQVRTPREGERKEKFNPLVRIDTVNGLDPEEARDRPEFSDLTPLFPTERLRLETTADELVGRVVDLVAPLGKGQRALLVSPPQAGKTMVLQAVADAITRNNPETHVMVVLVDERPEEVTDFTRSVRGEVIPSTFDRQPADHTVVAELAVERAKRLVELGMDVVLLVDGLTRLARAYNLSATGGGRVLAGGVDSSALHPTKKFFGAARNIEDGGSLTILATALADTGSATDEVILEELEGTANAEIRLRREMAERRVFPAVDVTASGTRRSADLAADAEVATTVAVQDAVRDAGLLEGTTRLVEKLRTTASNADVVAAKDPLG
ncbi:transcription termination factor Rho [Nocardioides bruguierae]|uniref:Transcription termination factor Rho n=1 Tax=Nocardioides bruguierae TaxID=2945102 RepID=A0A9X2D4F5_9ACTN|nr:transcription termination factor Rho [Nocardioides bruguierae]MCM0619197.1 transcription termination factor Rho [Nocardioides bruguierae]